MKYTDVIITILEHTDQAYRKLDNMEDLYGIHSPEADEARAAWHELYKLCKSIDIEWNLESR